MKKCDQDEFIEFEYNGEIFYCRITDNNEPIRTIRGIEKMGRYANFYDGNKNPVVTGWAVYGTVEEMTNITPFSVVKWYSEYLKEKR